MSWIKTRPQIIALLGLTVLLLFAGAASAQDQPAAGWIAHPDSLGNEYGVYHFRKEFEFQNVPDDYTIQVSADNRYRLYVNGSSVVAGPQRSDVMHYRYDVVDLKPYLREGRNVIAAVVWNWGPHKPVAQHSYRTGFLVRGTTSAEAILNTGGTPWQVAASRAYSAIEVSREAVGGYYASPPGERVDGRLYHWEWEQLAYDASEWPEAVLLRAVNERGQFPFNAGGWQLVPRTIPFMDEHPVRFKALRRTTGVESDGSFLTGGEPLVIPANHTATLVLDQGHLTNAYFRMMVSGGEGAKITAIFAEAAKDANGLKGHRDDIEGKTISGLTDVFIADGGNRRAYQSLWFRTYRYVQLDIETKETPLSLDDVSGLYSAYPYEMNARFESDQPWLLDMWDINWRVSRLCAWETYFDTPYYEQLQYVGDTRLQALITLYMSGDDRLMRQSITHFNLSRIPEGITASRYPSDLGQYIPTFSLIWVAMAHDYWMLRDDPDYVEDLMPGVRGVLAWFEKKVDATGLVGPMRWWPFIDWPEEWNSGMAPDARDGHSFLVTLQYVYALQRAIDLEKAFGRTGEATRLQALADALLEAVRKQGWDAERGLFRDSLEGDTFSQHTNTMAILTGLLTQDERRAVMERVLGDHSLTQAGYYFGFYVLEALREVGMADRYIEQLSPWQDMLAIGLTTTPENPGVTRTDSHAWAAHPNYGLLATVLGIRPAEPGFMSVMIEPGLGPLQRASGRLPHPLGDIDVALERAGRDGLKARIALPDGLTGMLSWRGENIHLRSGTQDIEL